MFMSRTISPVPVLVMLLSYQAEGKCKCVDYDRDWYVVVTSFASGLVLSAVLAFLLNCYCLRCGKAKASIASTNESLETLETQNHEDFNQFYEEVPDGENGDFQAIGSFNQTFRSDSIDSKTNLVVDVTHHGEPSQPAECQHPKIEMEHIYTECGMVDNDQSGPDEGGGTNQHGESSTVSRYQQPRKTPGHTHSETNPPVVSWSKETLLSNQDGETSMPSNYQHPKPERTYIDMTVRKEAKLPSGSEVSLANDQLDEHSENNAPSEYQHPRVDHEGNSVLPSESEVTSTTDKLDENSIQSDYQHPKPNIEHTCSESRVDQEGNSVTPSECGQTSRTEQVDLSAEAGQQRDYQHPRLDQGENQTSPTLPPRSKASPPTEPTSQINDHPGLKMKGSDKSNEGAPSKPPRYSKPAAVPPRAPSNYHTPSQHAPQTTKYLTPPPPKLAPPSAVLVPSSPPSDLSTEDRSQEDNYQCPGVKIWMSEGSNQDRKDETTGPTDLSSPGERLPTASKSQSPSPSSSGDGNSSREAGYQIPEIQAEFLENEGYSLPQPPRSSGNVESNLDADYQIPEIDTEFLDKSFIQPSSSPPVLPSRRPLRKSPSARPSMDSTSLTPPPLPARSLSQTSSFVSKTSTSSETPVLPPKTSSLKLPRIGQPTKTSGLSPPALPSKAPSQKSPSTTSSSPPTLPARRPSVKSPKTVPSKSPIPPPVPPKAAPLLPAKTKPVSPPASTTYAELNDLDRQDDDTANYQHLIPMPKH